MEFVLLHALQNNRAQKHLLNVQITVTTIRKEKKKTDTKRSYS